jgi:hypothetical protein
MRPEPIARAHHPRDTEHTDIPARAEVDIKLNMNRVYVFFYASVYRTLSRILHKFNLHYMPEHQIENDVLCWCRWCGIRAKTRTIFSYPTSSNVARITEGKNITYTSSEQPSDIKPVTLPIQHTFIPAPPIPEGRRRLRYIDDSDIKVVRSYVAELRRREKWKAAQTLPDKASD